MPTAPPWRRSGARWAPRRRATSGRPGTPTALRLTFPERRLSLTATRGWPEAEVQQVVRGVVLSRKQVPVEEWVRALATELTDLAARNASARAALAGLLGSP